MGMPSMVKISAFLLVVDDFATQAYGLVEPAPDHVKVDKNYDQCTGR